MRSPPKPRAADASIVSEASWRAETPRRPRRSTDRSFDPPDPVPEFQADARDASGQVWETLRSDHARRPLYPRSSAVSASGRQGSYCANWRNAQGPLGSATRVDSRPVPADTGRLCRESVCAPAIADAPPLAATDGTWPSEPRRARLERAPAGIVPSMPAHVRTEAVPLPRELVVPTVVAALGAAALAAKGLLLPVDMYDAGISASAGTFILHGLVPYRDFWMLYGPLTGYLAALVELLLPRSVTVVQLAGLVLVGLQAAAGYVLLRCLRVAAMAALMVAIVSAAASTSLVGLEISEWQCAVIAAMLALAVASSASTPRARLVAGAIVGVSLLFRQDVGLYAVVPVVLLTRSTRPLIGLAIVVVPVVLILLATAPAGALYEQLVWYPIVGPRVYRDLPGPLSTASGPVATALMILFVWGCRASIAGSAIRAIATRDQGKASLVVFALLCQLQTAGRGDFYHLAQAAGPAFLCLGTLFPAQTATKRWATAAFGGIVAVLTLVAAFAVPFTFPDVATYNASVSQAAAYVRQRTSPQQPIFVGLTTNRYTWVNPLMVYYLADRPPGVRDTMYNPGITNRDDTQREMISDLDSSNTQYLVLDRTFASTCEAFNASCELGSSRLDEFIGAEFRPAADFGDIVVMVRD